VISIIAQACQSLAEAHDAGLYHRDIKPANLFLCRAADEVDIVKLLDFGIVHNVADPIEVPHAPSPESIAALPSTTGERLTMVGTVIGTPGYIAPELAVGAPPGGSGDLYALGCVAWWLLTGGEVFPRPTEDEVIHAHVADAVPELRAKVRGWFPPELESIVLKCLEKSPSRRPVDARTLAEALFSITIPAEHAWARTQAVTWWASLGHTKTAAPDATTAAAGVAMVAPPAPRSEAATVVSVLVPQREDAPPASSSSAMTIEARPSSRGS
jgi:serine/threonine-protein kinase